ncbi:MAG TPA: hypothetical protein VE640_05065 [Candidatus Bathyarchaeia archaeon]|jgi:4-hydroxybenzoate polyprenyltransferase|nr:hypothetical protein [Candidatus Bathyarchaeia archaeon]
MAVLVSAISSERNLLRIHGIACIAPNNVNVSWITTVNWDDTQVTINLAITTAAVQAARAAGFIIDDILDRKTLFGVT